MGDTAQESHVLRCFRLTFAKVGLSLRADRASNENDGHLGITQGLNQPKLILAMVESSDMEYKVVQLVLLLELCWIARRKS